MDKKIDFWEEICGSVAFKRLGLKKFDKHSLEIFDQWYFSHYPYLNKYINEQIASNKTILEVGLGFGSVGQRLFKYAKEYIGVDLAKNPVDLMNERIKLSKKINSKAINSDVLSLPFKNDNFDLIVSIGCIHHTSSIKNSVDELYRVLKPGGKAIIMIYAKYSLATLFTPMYYLIDVFKNGFSLNRTRVFKRYLFDNNLNGDEAPQTIFSSNKDLKFYFEKFKLMKINRKNYWFPFLRKKKFFISSRLISIFGNDYYIELTK